MRRFIIILLSIVFILAGCADNDRSAGPGHFPDTAEEAAADEGAAADESVVNESIANESTADGSANASASQGPLRDPLSKDKASAGPGRSPEGASDEGDETDLTKKTASIIDSIIDPSMSECEKAKAIHDYLVIHVNYDYENLQSGSLPADAFTAAGAILNHSAVCQGYAEAFALLCGQAGLESDVVYGSVMTEDGKALHAWNQVRIDGLWYNIDVTWDDPLVENQNMTDGSNMIYDYFLVPDSVLEADHFPDRPESLHACTSAIYVEQNREWSIAPYLEEPYTIVSSPEQSLDAVTGYLQTGTLHFQIVYDTAPELAEEKMNLVMEQVKSAMESCRLYGQIELETQYGIADYALIGVTVTPQ